MFAKATNLASSIVAFLTVLTAPDIPRFTGGQLRDDVYLKRSRQIVCGSSSTACCGRGDDGATLGVGLGKTWAKVLPSLHAAPLSSLRAADGLPKLRQTTLMGVDATMEDGSGGTEPMRSPSTSAKVPALLS